MIDLAYIIESADYRMYRACPEIMTPDVKPYKPVKIIKCAICGRRVAVSRKAVNAKYCPGCQSAAQKAVKRRTQARLNELIREVESYTKSTLPCEKWCGRRSCADIIAVEKQAREQGLSYGAFMAKKRGNTKI